MEKNEKTKWKKIKMEKNWKNFFEKNNISEKRRIIMYKKLQKTEE